MANIFDIENEKYVLSGILRNPNIFSEVAGLIDENYDFKNRLHQVIWSVLKQTANSGEKIDRILIAQKINQLSLSFEDQINSVSDYLEALTLIPIHAENVINYVKSLKTLSLRRKVAEVGEELSSSMSKANNLNDQEIISLSDGIYTKVINSFSPNNEPEDLFAGIEEYIEKNGNTPDEDSEEIASPYSKYQEMFGGYFAGDLVLVCGQYKGGKSTFLLDTMRKVTTNPNVYGLYLDSELEIERQRRRIVSSLTGINEYFLKGNQWTKNPEMAKKIRSVFPTLKQWFNKLDHIYVANSKPAEIESIIRRWHWKRGNQNQNAKSIICMDYLKLTDKDDVREAYAGSMLLGYKCDRLKKLASELKCPIIGGCQANAAGDVGLSMEIKKFVSSAFYLHKKTSEDILREGDSSTHSLIPICNRDLGAGGDKVNLVKILDKNKNISYRPNHINYKIDSFNVTEINTLEESLNMKMDISIKKRESVSL